MMPTKNTQTTMQVPSKYPDNDFGKFCKKYEGNERINYSLVLDAAYRLPLWMRSYKNNYQNIPFDLISYELKTILPNVFDKKGKMFDNNHIKKIVERYNSTSDFLQNKQMEKLILYMKCGYFTNYFGEEKSNLRSIDKILIKNQIVLLQMTKQALDEMKLDEKEEEITDNIFKIEPGDKE